MPDPRARALVQDRAACACGHERRAHIFGDAGCTEHGCTCGSYAKATAPPPVPAPEEEEDG